MTIPELLPYGGGAIATTGTSRSMKSGETYPRNTALAVLLVGHPGAGKTNLCMEFPRPYFLDGDHNLRNAIERHPAVKFTYDDPEVDEKGSPIALEYSWARLEELIKLNGPKPEVGTIVVDGLGRVSDYLKAHLVRVGGEAEKSLSVGGMKVMTKSLWGPFADLMKKLTYLCRSYGKPFVMTSHLCVDENELTTVKEQRVLIQGQLKDDYPKLYTDYWYCNAQPNSAEQYKKSNGVRYFVRTAPDMRIMVKQSCGLPAEFEHDSVEFRKLVATFSPPPAPPISASQG